MTKVPHKHAEAIKARADGAQIQFRADDNHWEDCSNNRPSWASSHEYRVKPEPKPDTYHYSNWQRDMYTYCGNMSPEGANLKLTFDGETGKLKSAEVL